jgi:8-oxo-dGTP diphosphatase
MRPSRTDHGRCDDAAGMGAVEPLRVIAAAIVRERKVLLVSKAAAPGVFYLPGGKPEPGEAPLVTLARELREELDAELGASRPLLVLSDQAALERVPMEMPVFLCDVEGSLEPGAEIAALAWVDATGECPGSLAPAIRNHVLPFLEGQGLVA